MKPEGQRNMGKGSPLPDTSDLLKRHPLHAYSSSVRPVQCLRMQCEQKEVLYPLPGESPIWETDTQVDKEVKAAFVLCRCGNFMGW